MKVEKWLFVKTLLWFVDHRDVILFLLNEDKLWILYVIISAKREETYSVMVWILWRRAKTHHIRTVEQTRQAGMYDKTLATS